MSEEAAIVPLERVEAAIHVIRGQKVMLDSDLAALYGVETRILVRGVTRHAARFPADFMFRLEQAEVDRLRSQFGISNGRGGRRYAPYAFTEHGVAMLSSVLNSPRAIAVNIEVIRAFVRLREMALSYAELTSRLDELEGRYDGQFALVFDAIHELTAPPPALTRHLGFREERVNYGA